MDFRPVVGLYDPHGNGAIVRVYDVRSRTYSFSPSLRV